MILDNSLVFQPHSLFPYESGGQVESTSPGTSTHFFLPTFSHTPSSPVTSLGEHITASRIHPFPPLWGKAYSGSEQSYFPRSVPGSGRVCCTRPYTASPRDWSMAGATSSKPLPLWPSSQRGTVGWSHLAGTNPGQIGAI